MFLSKARGCVLLFCFLLLWAFVLSSVCLAQGSQIVVIDMQKVLRNSKAGKQAMQELNKKFEVLKKQLQAKQKELQTFKQDIEKRHP